MRAIFNSISYLAAISKMAPTILRSCDSSLGLARSWVHGNSSRSYKCHFSCSELTKSSVKSRVRLGKYPNNGKQELVFSWGLVKHSCVTQCPVGITDIRDRKPLRSLSPGSVVWIVPFPHYLSSGGYLSSHWLALLLSLIFMT